MEGDWEVEVIKILFSPQVSKRVLIYEFIGNRVKVNLDGETDIFDFEAMPDGFVENPLVDIDTSLEINPFIEVSKVDGVLSLKLLNFIKDDAIYEERFPEWFEVKI